VFLETGTTLALLDAYPVTEGHVLVIPKRHVASIFELPPEELAALWAQVATVRRLLAKKCSPDAFNIGVNDGAAAGQTVAHAPRSTVGTVNPPSPRRQLVGFRRRRTYKR
jgi:diadenosine tetraphosphate (Ap4A) HIT family hydrolase